MLRSLKKWSSEAPNLYTLVIALEDESGKVIETISNKIGFKKIEVKDGRILLNGEKFMMKGVNRHAF